MTIEERKLANKGKDFWSHYTYLNGYAFYPTEEGLKKLSGILDLNIPYLKRCINLYLEA